MSLRFVHFLVSLEIFERSLKLEEHKVSSKWVSQDFAENVGFFGYHEEENIMGLKVTSDSAIEFSTLKWVEIDRLGIVVELMFNLMIVYHLKSFFSPILMIFIAILRENIQFQKEIFLHEALALSKIFDVNLGEFLELLNRDRPLNIKLKKCPIKYLA